MYKVSKNTDAKSKGLASVEPAPVTPPEDLSWWESVVRNSRLFRLLRGTGVPIDPVVDKATQALVGAPPQIPVVEGDTPMPDLPLPNVPLPTVKSSNYNNPAAYNVPGGGMTVANAPAPVAAPVNPGAPVSPGPIPGQGMSRTGSFKGANAQQGYGPTGQAVQQAAQASAPQMQPIPSIKGAVQGMSTKAAYSSQSNSTSESSMMQGNNPMSSKEPGKAPALLPVSDNAQTDSSLAVPRAKQSSVVRNVMNFFSEGAQNSKAIKNMVRELRGVDSEIVNMSAAGQRADQRGIDAFRKSLSGATGGSFTTPKELKDQKDVFSEMLKDYSDQQQVFRTPTPEGASELDQYIGSVMNPLSGQYGAQAATAQQAIHHLNNLERRATRAAIPHVAESARLAKDTKALIAKKKVLKNQISELQPDVKKYQNAIDLGVGAAGIGVTAGGLGYLHKEGSDETPFDRMMQTKFANEFSSVVRDLTTPFVGPSGNENLENILAASGGMGLGAVVAQNVGQNSLRNQARSTVRPLYKMMRDVQDAEGLGFPFRNARSVAADRLLAEADNFGLDGKKLLSSIRRGADLRDMSSDLLRHSIGKARKSRRLPGALLGGLAGLTGLGLMRDMAPTKQMNRELLRAQIDQMRGGQGVMDPSQYAYEVATQGSGRYM